MSMNAGECCARELLRQLLGFMEEPDYEIHSIHRIRERAEHAVIISMDLDGREWNVVPQTWSGIPSADFVLKTEALPQTIDFPPVIRNGNLIRLKPVVLVNDNCDIRSTWVTVHEFCHLLAIGPYELIGDGTIRHTAGLMSYVYESCEYGQVKGTAVGDEKQNELFNDFVTWHFMERLFEGEALPPRREALYLFRKRIEGYCGSDASFLSMIGQYFDGTITSTWNSFSSGSQYCDR